MASETLRSLSKRLGITKVDVSKKASEFERLMEVRGCSLTLTSVAKSVICLEIAANNSQVPVDKVSFELHDLRSGTEIRPGSISDYLSLSL